MTEDKSGPNEASPSKGQVPPTVGKSIEFGEVPPKLNLAGEVFLGGDVAPKLNLAGEILEKGMAPQPLPKIPLSQIAQPCQPPVNSPRTSTSTPDSSDSGSGSSGAGGSDDGH